MIGQIFFYSGGLGANGNVSGKLGMKLAITLWDEDLNLRVTIGHKLPNLNQDLLVCTVFFFHCWKNGHHILVLNGWGCVFS